MILLPINLYKIKIQLTLLLFLIVGVDALYSQNTWSALNDSINTYAFIDYDKAIVFAEELYTKAYDSSNDSLIFSAINKKVELYLIHSRLKEYNRERLLFKSRLDSLSEFDSSLSKELIQLHMNDGMFLSTKMMQNEKAALQFQAALALLETQKYDPNYNYTKYRIYNWLSQITKKSYRTHEAITYMENAIQAYIEHEEIEDIAAVNDLLQEYMSLADLYKQIGNNKLYEKHLKTSILKANRLRKKYPNNKTYLIMAKNCYDSEFDNLIEKNELQKAASCLEKIGPLNSSPQDKSDYMLKLSQLEFGKENFSHSNAILVEEINKDTKTSTYSRIKFRSHLSNNYIVQGKYKQAQNHLSEIYNLVFGKTLKLEDLKLAGVKYDYYLKEVLEQQSRVLLLKFQDGKSSEVNSELDSYLNFSFDYISSKRRNISAQDDIINSTNTFRKIINNYIKIKALQEDIIGLSKAVDFAKSFSLEFSKLKNQYLENDTLQDLRIQEIALRNKILKFEKAILSNEYNQASNNDSLIYYRNKYGELEKSFITNHKLFDELKYDQKGNLSSLTKGVGKDQSILNYYVLENELFILHKTKDSIQIIRNKDLTKLQENIEADIERLIKIKPLEHINEISNILLPKELELKEHIVIMPHAYLHYLPFDILQYKNTKIFQDHNLSYSHTEELINNEVEEGQAFSFLGLSPQFNKSCSALQPLLHNHREISIISSLFSAKNIHHENEMNLPSFKEACKTSSVIHLATHAILDHSNPNKSFVALGSACQDSLKNRLYLKDILGLNMQPELVVLSSCNSALGELVNGEGLTSLSKSLFHSNTKSVVSTLWSINDESTAMIMAAFYQNLKNGHTKDQALRKAKMEYLSKVDPSYAHPYYWAGIIAMGDMRPIFSGSSQNRIMVIVAVVLLLGLVYMRRRKVSLAA